MRRLPVLGLVMAVLVLVAAACGDDGGGEAAEATSTTAAAVQESVEPYFEALSPEAFATPDPAAWEAAQQCAAPGSHAETYAVIVAEMNTGSFFYTGLVLGPTVAVTGEAVAECFPDPADLYGFGEPPPPPSEPAEPGEPYGGERCFDIGDTTVDEDGLLAGFTVDGNELSERLALSGTPVESDGVSFTLIGGYQDGLGTLDVVVEVANNAESPFVLPQLHQGLYVDPDGKQIDSTGYSVEPASLEDPPPESLGHPIQPGATATVVEVFPSAAPGGTYTVGGTLDDGTDTEVTVDIPIALTES